MRADPSAHWHASKSLRIVNSVGESKLSKWARREPSGTSRPPAARCLHLGILKREIATETPKQNFWFTKASRGEGSV